MNRIESITLKQVSKTFSNQNTVLNGFTNNFHKNDLIVITGVSGVGKTTLLQLIGLLDHPTQGEILYDGIAYQNQSENIRQRFIQEHISYLFQGTNLNVDLRLRDNLLLVSRDLQVIEDITVSLQIQHLLDQKVLKLSKGEKARAALARTLLEDKSILLLDEPAANLDDVKTKLIYDVIKAYTQDKIVFMVSHKKTLELPYSHRLLDLTKEGFVEKRVEHSHEYTPKLLASSKGLKKPLIKTSVVLYKKHPIKLGVFLALEPLLFLLIILLTASLSLKESQIIKNRLLDTHLYYIPSNNPHANDAYLKQRLVFTYEGDVLSVDSYFSKDDHFRFKGETFHLLENEIIIPKYIGEQYSIETGDSISLLNQTVTVKSIYDESLETYLDELNPALQPSKYETVIRETIPLFVSSNVLKNYIEVQGTTLDSKWFTQASQTLKQETSLSLAFRRLNLKTAPSILEEDEIILSVSSLLKPEYETTLNGLISKTLTFNVDSLESKLGVKNFPNTVRIKDVIYEDTSNPYEVGFYIQETYRLAILDGLFENEVIPYKTWMFPIYEDLKIDVKKLDIDTYEICPKVELDLLSLNATYELAILAVTALVVLLILFTYVLVSNGIYKDYKSINQLYFTIGISSFKRGFLYTIPLYGFTLIAIFMSLFILKRPRFIRSLNDLFGLEESILIPEPSVLFVYTILSIVIIQGFLSYFKLRVKTDTLYTRIKE